MRWLNALLMLLSYLLGNVPHLGVLVGNHGYPHVCLGLRLGVHPLIYLSELGPRFVCIVTRPLQLDLLVHTELIQRLHDLTLILINNESNVHT